SERRGLSPPSGPPGSTRRLARALSARGPVAGKSEPTQGGSSMVPQLRVYPAPEDASNGEAQEATIRVSLGELLPLVALAHRHNYVWLRDFLDDEVVITSDLFEVLRSFRCFRPSA